MSKKSGSALLTLVAIGVLALAATPTVQSWRYDAAASRAATAAAVASLPDATDPAWTNQNQIEIQFRDGTDDNALAELSKKIGAPITWNSELHAETEVARVTLPEGSDIAGTLETLRADGNVEIAEQIHLYTEPEAGELAAATPDNNEGDAPDSNRWKPNDPLYKEQWNFAMVKAEEAWETTKGKGVVVAVIDTGVAYGDTKKGKIARDFKQTKFVKGYDFVNHDEMPNDDQGHGTHVAGTIAESTDNKEGVAGLAFEASIMPIKVLSASGGGTSADIGEGIRWAADHGANIINMSLGGPFPDKLMQSACTYASKKGVTIVCAAGNSGREGVGFPAGFKECIAVSAVGPKGDLSFYSSWGKEVAIAAPGGDSKVGGPAEGKILQNTTMNDGSGNMVDDYYGFQGTSMASPHVAAIAALVESQGVKDPEDVKCVLQKSAVKKGPSNKYGAGIVDAAAAVKLAANTYGDGVTRFWLVGALFAGCYLIGRKREKNHERGGYPFWGTAALAFGLLFPDWLTGYLGMSSHVNIVAHSILIPGALFVLGAKGAAERRLLGWMALGLTLHLGWEFLRGTTPAGIEVGTWQLLPWVAANVAIGFSMALSGLSAKND